MSFIDANVDPAGHMHWENPCQR